jgi:DNA replication ATP-dependent helicase Dna2
MLWQAGRLDLARSVVELVYTNGDTPETFAAALDWREIRSAVFTRNQAVLFDLTGRPSGPRADCDKCPRFRKSDCTFYGDLLGLAPRFTTDDADRETFRRWVAALRSDAALTAQTDLRDARRSVAHRVDAGTCFRVDSVGEETVDLDGAWRARLVGANISRFRVGDRVTLAEDDPAGRVVSAEVDAIDPHWIAVSAEEPAPWTTRVEQSATGALLQGVFQGLTGWLRADDRLRKLVAGAQPPRVGPAPPADPTLDEFQQQAAQLALSTQDYALIWGPPGSGKTRTIARIVRNAGARVLLTAFTNQAVDNLALALLADGQNDFLIIGRPERSHPTLKSKTLDALGDDPPAIRSALAECPVILATAHQVGSGRYDRAFGQAPPFGLVILDEATQVTEPVALGALRLGKAFVLVGDHRQLSPIVAGDSSPLATSLFQRLWNDPVSAGARAMLRRQYRMREAIAAFSSARWYGGALVTAPTAEQRPPVVVPESRWPALWNGAPAVFAAVTARDEAPVVARLVREALRAGVPPDQIGVIAPYRQQVAAIALALSDCLAPPLIDTVDRFQGSERDVIVLATGSHRDAELIADERRLNVALTRARRKLIVVGDPAVLRGRRATAALLEHFRQLDQVVDIKGT